MDPSLLEAKPRKGLGASGGFAASPGGYGEGAGLELAPRRRFVKRPLLLAVLPAGAKKMIRLAAAAFGAMRAARLAMKYGGCHQVFEDFEAGGGAPAWYWRRAVSKFSRLSRRRSA
jgi:hypothetical protein